MSEKTGQALSALLAKLEAATEGSGKLSWDIAEALGWTKYWNSLTIYLPPGATEESGPWHDNPPAYSESLDAAMTLCDDSVYPPAGAGVAWWYDVITYAAVQSKKPNQLALNACRAAVRARLAGQKEHP